ncbi:MAG: tRNA pseudouridine(55) synthase TruB [Nocardioides sp.]|uniref:tRNA pseudouridine(55) synthase TruB n=1 Tax=Nocardioides nematodiphilus TaxID=2849669 RepID=UPI001CD97E37|nr:tRNA pseudouridine(55) synthase TruB [Nocardioides nematodiphilus]MCA1984027.1 tRNA pseudouridine(55) synthase TruB [Nocardioides nematodiphilus]
MPAEPRPTVPSGLVVVDKAGAMTSHDVVARVRRLAGTRKVGHAGTLDPMATGVLIIGIERATRLLGHLMLTEKAYDATVRLGMTTTTDDADGEFVGHWSTASLDEDQIRAAFAEQVGALLQVPSAVSAIKVDGKRAYQRVREGEEVELKARPVTVHELTVRRLRRDPGGPGGELFIDVDISVRCSSGTYIRAIARDVGAALGVGGHLTALRRTAVGPYGLDVAHTLDELGEDFQVLPIAEAARRAFPVVELDEQQAADVRVGRKLAISVEVLSAVFAPDGEFLALYEPIGSALAKPVAVFV